MGAKTIERIAEELGVNFHDLFPLIAARDKKYFKAGIREVLAWEEEHDVIGYVYDTDDPEVEKQNMIDHANQLKKWGE